MYNKTYLYIAVVFIIVAAASTGVLFYRKQTKKVEEGFAGMGVSFKVKANPEFVDNKGYFYSVPPNLQAAVAPRFSGTATYGPYLNTEKVARNIQGVPINPLTHTNTIKKCGNGVNVFNSDMKMKGYNETEEGFNTVAPNFTASNYQAAEDKLKDRGTFANELLPQSTAMATDGSTTVSQPIVYDRYIYANQKSRLHGLGDPIRGDLPIVPYNGDWFRPSVQPNIDLRDGAMMVLAGENNATARNTMALMRESSGNTMNTFAGAPVMSNQTNLNYGAGGADVIATAFP